MLGWLRRMLDRRDPRPEAGVSQDDRRLLQAGMARQKQILTRADDAIRKAMQHADQAIAQKPYTGPERRGAPRNR